MHQIIISCEHGGNELPGEYAHLFLGMQEELSSHRGWDIGALAIARQLSRELQSPLFYSTVTRLLVDLNRSVDHPQLFCPVVRRLPAADRERIRDWYYHPHHFRMEREIYSHIRNNKTVLHLAIHSFTPILKGQTRQADIGLLFDPAHSQEKKLCRHLMSSLKELEPTYAIRMNYPYRGSSDGLCTEFRKLFDKSHYLGVEIEINQKWLTGPEERSSKITTLFSQAIPIAMTNF